MPPLRVCFVADYRSPIARQWIQFVANSGIAVQVISSRRVTASVDGLIEAMEFEPLGLEAMFQARRPAVPPSRPLEDVEASRSRRLPRRPHILDSGLRKAQREFSSSLGPLQIRLRSEQLRRRIDRFKPDLVHGMRIPYEAMAAALAVRSQALVTSIWGNDLTLFAKSNRLLASGTRRTLKRTTALHVDCNRDLQLASLWGFNPSKPHLVIPGCGGIDPRLFFPGMSLFRTKLGIPAGVPVLLNPRGVREYVHIPEFLRAAQIVLGMRTDLHVLAAGMRGHAWIEETVARWPERDRFHLLPVVSHRDMGDVYRSADMSVSLTSHDGTPNSLLESLASGCFPIVGPVESVLEWVQDGVTGLVVDPTDVGAMVTAVVRAIDDTDLRRSAALINAGNVRERADLDASMNRALVFYAEVLDGHRASGGDA